MKLINKHNSNTIITSFICGAEHPRISNALTNDPNLLSIHRVISRVHKSCVIPTDDAVIIQFIRFVQPTRFRDISTTPFYSYGYRHQGLLGSTWAAGAANMCIMRLQEHRKRPSRRLRLCVLGALPIFKSIETTAISIVSVCAS